MNLIMREAKKLTKQFAANSAVLLECPLRIRFGMIWYFLLGLINELILHSFFDDTDCDYITLLKWLIFFKVAWKMVLASWNLWRSFLYMERSFCVLLFYGMIDLWFEQDVLSLCQTNHIDLLGRRVFKVFKDDENDLKCMLLKSFYSWFDDLSYDELYSKS